MEGVDPYKVLGVNKNFTMEELKSNFKKLVMKHHPDRTQDIQSLPVFQVLSGCYKLLMKDLEIRKAEKPHINLKNTSHSFIEQQTQQQFQNRELVPPNKKFNIEKFNQVFSSVKVKDQGDDGYESWMNNPSSYDSKHNRALIKYT
jgi:DnaJ-class molecular chaperone